jgi:hypothetical protein
VRIQLNGVAHEPARGRVMFRRLVLEALSESRRTAWNSS